MSAQQAGSSDRRSKRAAASHRTKMCWFYPRDKCAQGESCAFAHTTAEFRPKSDDLDCVPCRHWARGFCRSGDACRYSHDSVSASSSSSSSSEQPAIARQPTTEFEELQRILLGQTAGSDQVPPRRTPGPSSYSSTFDSPPSPSLSGNSFFAREPPATPRGSRDSSHDPHRHMGMGVGGGAATVPPSPPGFFYEYSDFQDLAFLQQARDIPPMGAAVGNYSGKSPAATFVAAPAAAAIPAADFGLPFGAPGSPPLSETDKHINDMVRPQYSRSPSPPAHATAYEYTPTLDSFNTVFTQTRDRQDSVSTVFRQTRDRQDSVSAGVNAGFTPTLDSFNAIEVPAELLLDLGPRPYSAAFRRLGMIASRAAATEPPLRLRLPRSSYV
eukprot:TRINITY_DN1509_c0_g1_i1.p1 TRINITY_DN1509_c0_g1~~TRINITY_DN1509_c0_g1_i1.p1  ORF type:complete len:384 (+),score=54.02 TRINITY_DN1509_c0_g1_i1:109-1260(+)